MARKQKNAPGWKGLALALGVALGGWFIHSIAPWYAVAGIAFIGGWAAGLPGGKASAWAALGAALLWGGSAGWINLQNESILATRVGALLGGVAPVVLVLVTALWGALLGGLGGWLGAQLRPAPVRRYR
jgi:hypothetical protein